MTPVDGQQDAAQDGASVREAARLLGISTAAVRKRIRRGTLPALKVGEQWFVAREGLDAGTPAGRAAVQDAGYPVGQDTSGTRAVDASYDAGRDTPDAGRAAGRDGEVRRLEEQVALLHEEVAVRRREVQQLHTLLAQAQQLALPPPAASPETQQESHTGQRNAELEREAVRQERRPWWKLW